MKLWAGYTEGRVEGYSSDETEVMCVIKNPETGEVYPSWIGPGIFLIPENAMQ